MVIAAAITLGVVGLTGCGTPDSPAALTPTKAAKATTPTTSAPSTKAVTPTTKAPEPGAIAVAGFKPAVVGTANRFVEKFALAAMSGCSPKSLPNLQGMMTPALYRSALTSEPFILTFDPPWVMSPGCVTSQTLSAGRVSAGRVWSGVPTVRVAVTVTQGMKVSTTSSPKTLKPFTVTRRYTVDVLPSGTDWLAHRVSTGNTTVAGGK